MAKLEKLLRSNLDAHKNTSSQGLKPDTAFDVQSLNLFYGRKHVLKDVSVQIYKNKITSVVGASGCGKSSLLRQLNRMNDFIHGARSNGEIIYQNKNILAPGYDVTRLRRHVGMVFQKPNPFPQSIYKNIVWAPRWHAKNKNEAEMVENCLTRVGLWDDVKDHLHDSALTLSGGQQQRLCIARALAIRPDVILMDEPCSALDPKATLKIEQLIQSLADNYSIVIVTHNMQQAARISDYTQFYHKGQLIEAGLTGNIFTRPQHKKTKAYVERRFGGF